MPQRVEDRLRPITPQLAWRVAVLGGIAFVLFGIVFFRLWYLQVLTGRGGARLREPERPPDGEDRGPARRHRGPQRPPAGATKKAAVVQLVPSTLPEQVREQADEYRKQVAAAENERPRTRRSTTRSSASSRTTGARRPRPRSASSTAAGTAAHGPQGRDPADPGRARARGPLPPHLRDHRHPPKTIHERVIRGIADTPYSNVTIRTDVPPAEFNYMRERPEYFKGIVVTKRNLRYYPRASSPRSCSARSRRSPRTQRNSDSALQGRRRRARGSARAASSGSTTKSCAARTAPRASSSTRSAAATNSARSR